MDFLTAVGLGLDYSDLRFGRTTQAWLDAGDRLRTQVAEALDGFAPQVELVGSSSVLGLLAKPVIDLAVGLTSGYPMSSVTAKLQAAGWIYRGDAGDRGGHVFVLECRPWHRVAHLHVVDHNGDQWRAYLRFREVLRRSPTARERYEAVKLRLAEQRPVDRRAYTDGKTAIVTSIIDEVDSCADAPPRIRSG
ncbi:GrpB family protein [Plantactinospora siamensis]|uniref:GrpB family protein n=1 Tax=Plantactinospora siamensis TaxID=555372 RepID=A0ABV6P584_9ACTN